MKQLKDHLGTLYCPNALAFGHHVHPLVVSLIQADFFANRGGREVDSVIF